MPVPPGERSGSAGGEPVPAGERPVPAGEKPVPAGVEPVPAGEGPLLHWPRSTPIHCYGSSMGILSLLVGGLSSIGLALSQFTAMEVARYPVPADGGPLHHGPGAGPPSTTRTPRLGCECLRRNNSANKHTRVT